MEDKRIIGLLRQRAQIAIEVPAKKFGKRLMSIAMNILGIYQDAEESVSDTYLAAMDILSYHYYASVYQGDLGSINQDTRVAIDEEGVTAASYILLEFGAGAAPPSDEIIDFVLDRPFVFAISSDQIPLFVRTVNMP